MSALIEQLMKEYDEMPSDGFWDGGHPILQMAEHIDSLQRERNELAAQGEWLRLAILNAIPFIPGGSVKANLRDAYDETPPAALAALKAQWQADILAEISLQVSASKPVATPIQIATAIMKESNNIRQRAQEAGDE